MIVESNKKKVVLKDYSKSGYLPERPRYTYAYMVVYNQQPMYAIRCSELEGLPTVPSYSFIGDYYLVNPEHVFTPEEASILLADRDYHEQTKETETMKQLYVRLSGEVLVVRAFSRSRWYPVTVNDPSVNVGYIIDNKGESYLLDLHRLHNNPAWISRTVDLSLPRPLSDNY